MKRFLALLLALAPALGPGGPAAAGAFSDLVMAPGVLGELAEGPVARYALMRQLPARAEGDGAPGQDAGVLPLAPVAEGRLDAVAVAGDSGMQIVLRRSEDGKAQPEVAFPAGGPNPVLLFFLENVVRVMAAETGGSPFYIRNRIREALGAAGLAEGPGPQTLILTPFAQDANRARMGDFATLSIAITFDPAAPGRVLELKADTGAGDGGYTESLRLIAEE